MPTSNGNRKILDLKRWEFCTPAPAATAAGHFIVSSRHYRQQQLLVQSNTVAYIYNPSEDGWVQVPSPALAGTFGAGACGTAASFSTGATAAAASLTATAGTTTSLTTNQNLQRDLRGYSVLIVGGTNAGRMKTIAANTLGANAVLQFTDVEATSFDATSQYRLLTPTFYVLGAGTLASGSFKRYDFATNSWITLAHTGLPATIGTDGRLIATPAWIDNGFKVFAIGTATAGGANTLTNAAKNWTTNQWANSQLRLTAGSGAGQIRTVLSNTATTLTLSSAWSTAPDATTQYSLEGNDDVLYFIGNNAVTLYRYSISANSWSTLSPTTARAAAPGAGLSGHWVHSVSASDWTNENTIRNGRYLYCFRGGAGALLDRYDIAANTWENALAYAPATETFGAGTKLAYNGDFLYLQKDVTSRWFRYDFAQSAMDGWTTMLYPQGAAVVGDTAFDVTYRDGNTEIVYIHMLLNSSAVNLRQLVI
ncbi:MAG: hypothetical protein WCI65_12975 [Synechococcaceae cyanobacterium ELA263]